jgi:hypothetical protein
VSGCYANTDGELPNEREAGTSAIVAVVEHTWVAELEKEMEAADAEVSSIILTEEGLVDD